MGISQKGAMVEGDWESMEDAWILLKGMGMRMS